MRGGGPIVDVRDLAAVHAALMEPGRGPRRFMIAGHYVAMPDLIAMLQEITGRRTRIVAMPAGLALAAGRAADLVQRPSCNAWCPAGSLSTTRAPGSSRSRRTATTPRPSANWASSRATCERP